MNARIKSHGRAAAEVLRWLHAKPVRGIVLDRPLDYAAEPLPRNAGAAEIERNDRSFIR